MPANRNLRSSSRCSRAGSAALVILISIVLWALIAAAGGALFMWLFA